MQLSINNRYSEIHFIFENTKHKMGMQIWRDRKSFYELHGECWDCDDAGMSRASIAGLYVETDNTRGVWKSPDNIQLNCVNVRRTMMYIAASIRNCANAFIFEPNDFVTWNSLRLKIDYFLRRLWKCGALQGRMPEEAFEIHIGLGDAMTADDIFEGIIRVRVIEAINRPSDFYEISIESNMQKS